MPEAVGPTQVHHYERQTHQNRRDGQQLAEDDEVVELLIFVEVNRDDEHDRRRRDADEEGEVRDVNAPRDLVRHVRGDKAVDELLRVGVEAHEAEGEEQAGPSVVAPVALTGELPAAGEEAQKVFGRLSHVSK